MVQRILWPEIKVLQVLHPQLKTSHRNAFVHESRPARRGSTSSTGASHSAEVTSQESFPPKEWNKQKRRQRNSDTSMGAYRFCLSYSLPGSLQIPRAIQLTVSRMHAFERHLSLFETESDMRLRASCLSEGTSAKKLPAVLSSLAFYISTIASSSPLPTIILPLFNSSKRLAGRKVDPYHGQSRLVNPLRSVCR